IGERRVVLEVNVVEFRNQLVFAPFPVMNQRSNDPPRLEPGIETDAVEQLEGGRMVGARARNLLEEIILAQGLDQCDLTAFLRECKGRARPARSGTDDNAALRSRQVFATTSLTAPPQRVWVR